MMAVEMVDWGSNVAHPFQIKFAVWNPKITTWRVPKRSPFRRVRTWLIGKKHFKNKRRVSLLFRYRQWRHQGALMSDNKIIIFLQKVAPYHLMPGLQRRQLPLRLILPLVAVQTKKWKLRKLAIPRIVWWAKDKTNNLFKGNSNQCVINKLQETQIGS